MTYRKRTKTYEPKTPEQFRRDMETVAKIFTFHLHTLLGWKAGNVAYRYDDEALDKISAQYLEILATIRDGRIIKLREPINPERQRAVTAAESDLRFQRFLARLNLWQTPPAA